MTPCLRYDCNILDDYLLHGLRNLQLHHHPILFTLHQLVSDTEVGVDVGFPPFTITISLYFNFPISSTLQCIWDT